MGVPSRHARGTDFLFPSLKISHQKNESERDKERKKRLRQKERDKEKGKEREIDRQTVRQTERQTHIWIFSRKRLREKANEANKKSSPPPP